MNWALVAALAAVGLVTGWCLRGIVFRQAVPAGAPPATACPVLAAAQRAEQDGLDVNEAVMAAARG